MDSSRCRSGSRPDRRTAARAGNRTSGSALAADLARRADAVALRIGEVTAGRGLDGLAAALVADVRADLPGRAFPVAGREQRVAAPYPLGDALAVRSGQGSRLAHQSRGARSLAHGLARRILARGGRALARTVGEIQLRDLRRRQRAAEDLDLVELPVPPTKFPGKLLAMASDSSLTRLPTGVGSQVVVEHAVDVHAHLGRSVAPERHGDEVPQVVVDGFVPDAGDRGRAVRDLEEQQARRSRRTCSPGR